jgi:hypothetical protein
LLNDAADNDNCDGFRITFDDDVMKVKVKVSHKSHVDSEGVEYLASIPYSDIRHN